MLVVGCKAMGETWSIGGRLLGTANFASTPWTTYAGEIKIDPELWEPGVNDYGIAIFRPLKDLGPGYLITPPGNKQTSGRDFELRSVRGQRRLMPRSICRFAS